MAGRQLLILLPLLLVACGAPAPAAAPAATGAATVGPRAAAPASTATVPATPAPGPSPTPPVLATVRFGLQPLAVFGPVYIGDERGYFRQEGVPLELVNFGNSSEMLPALATGQIDASGFSTNAAVWNSVARGINQRMVLEMGAFKPGYGSTSIVVRRDLYDAGRGRRLEDLRGLTLAFTPPGAATGNGCAASLGLRQAGLALDDLTITSVPFPDMVAALANGSVDGAMIAEPFLTRVLRQGTAVKVVGLDELYPDFTVAVISFSSNLYANRPAAKGFVRAYLRASRDYAAAINNQSPEPERARIYEILARATRIDADTLRDMVPSWPTLNGLPNRDSLLYCYQFFRDQGQVPAPVTDAQFAALWGTDLVEEVLAEIGRLPGN